LSQPIRILGIETSCDESAVAIYDAEQGILSHHLYSQVKTHNEYGGVVPELASRDHVRKLTPLVAACMQEAGCTESDISAIAFTRGPGLIGALLVGATVANALAFAWQKPVLGIHHLEGHLLAPLLEKDAPDFPFLALLVSGGHTMLVEVKGLGDYHIIGESIDDAAGEAFDKTAKIMGLDYPGGPLLSKLASQGDGSEKPFPRPMTDRPGLDFSFSGLKTFAANRVKEAAGDPQRMANIAQAFEEAVVDTLLIKCRRALKQTGYRQLVVAGGVSANTRLRARLAELMQSQGGQAFYPRHEYCTDNGAMIAYAGFRRFADLGEGAPAGSIEVNPRWPITDISL